MQHKIYLPREWIQVFRSIIALDGLGKTLSVDIDILSLMNQHMSTIIKEKFSSDRMIREGLWFSKNILSTLNLVPRQLRYFFKVFSSRNFVVELRNVEQTEALNRLSYSIQFFSFSFLMSVTITLAFIILFFKGLESNQETIPFVVLLLLSSYFFLRASRLVK